MRGPSSRAVLHGKTTGRLSHEGCQRERKRPGLPGPSRCIATGPALESHACGALSSGPAITWYSVPFRPAMRNSGKARGIPLAPLVAPKRKTHPSTTTGHRNQQALPGELTFSQPGARLNRMNPISASGVTVKDVCNHCWAGQGTSYPPSSSESDSWTMVYPAEGSLGAVAGSRLRWRMQRQAAEA